MTHEIKKIYDDLQVIFEKAMEKKNFATALKAKETQLKLLQGEGSRTPKSEWGLSELKNDDLKKFGSALASEIDVWRSSHVK